VGVKIGSDVDSLDLLNVISKINPHNEIGKVSLITRLGARDVRPTAFASTRTKAITVPEPFLRNRNITNLGSLPSLLLLRLTVPERISASVEWV
jgi:hypothetical protein